MERQVEIMGNEFDYRSFFELDEGDTLKKVVMTTYSFDISLLPLIWLYAGKEGHLIKYLDSFGSRRFYKNVFSDYINVSGSPLVTVFYQEDLMTNSSLRDNDPSDDAEPILTVSSNGTFVRSFISISCSVILFLK